MAVNAAPTTRPTARSMMLPREMNALKSYQNVLFFLSFFMKSHSFVIGI